jgi:hypothetical protein
MTYNHAIRKVGLSRGGKEGNTAFERDLEGAAYPHYYLANGDPLARIICDTETISKATLQLLGATLSYSIGDAVRAGNLTVASYMCMHLGRRDKGKRARRWRIREGRGAQRS